MVGLVLVSLSRKLAEAACQLALTVSPDPLPIDYAGGGAAGTTFGVDATDIMEAILRVSSGEGVLVLMDHSDAVVAARLAEQLLGSDAPRVRLCGAPLIEGGMAAAAKIVTGADIDAVHKEARNALDTKYRNMEDDLDYQLPAASSGTAVIPADTIADLPDGAAVIRFGTTDPDGLHLRPAALLHQTLSQYSVEARIRNYNSQTSFVNAASITQIALADISPGGTAEIAIWGPDASEAVQAVRRLIRDKLQGFEIDTMAAETIATGAVCTTQNKVEDDTPEALTQLAPGVAVGILYLYEPRNELLPPLPVADAEYEIARLDATITRIKNDLAQRQEKLAAVRSRDAEIFAVQLLILQDPGILAKVYEDIRRHSRDAASCYQARMFELAEDYEKLGNPVIRQRAREVKDVCNQVLDALAGKAAVDFSATSNVILCADEIVPSLIGHWAPWQIRGILTRTGSSTSHAAILAKSLGVPALGGYTPPPEATTGLSVAIDANRQEVVIQPEKAVLADYETRLQEWQKDTEQDRAAGKLESITKDGVAIHVLANIGDLASAESALENGAEGVGLLRTELMFLDRERQPGEDEQIDRLTEIFAVCGNRPITVRTVDILTGDGAKNARPNLKRRSVLGVRGVRAYEKRPELLLRQLRAILRAAVGRDVSILIPMVTTVAEVDFCRRILDECHNELAASQTPHLWPVNLGVMVETPAAALYADGLARRVDFFAVGTNDLTQFIMCAQRDSRELSDLFDGLQPAVLQAIAMVAEAAAQHQLPLTVCGEIAGDPAAVKILLGLGVRRLSVNAGSGGRVKRIIRECDTQALATVSRHALRLESASAVRRLV